MVTQLVRVAMVIRAIERVFGTPVDPMLRRDIPLAWGIPVDILPVDRGRVGAVIIGTSVIRLVIPPAPMVMVVRFIGAAILAVLILI